VLAVPGYRIVNCWLPLLPGAVAYLGLRLVKSASARTPVKTLNSAERAAVLAP
jgi:hypothetical protein